MASNISSETLQRLAASRQALLRHMSHESGEQDPHTDGDSAERDIDASSGTWGLLKTVVTSWWHNHPAHVAMDVVKPLMQTYARDKPLQLLGISAGIGVVVAVLRPWRLISVTGLLLAAAKSAEVSGVVKSLLTRDSMPHRTR
jgi:hypothetical protein